MMISLLLAVTATLAPVTLDSLSFSRADVETLREIQRVRDIGSATASLLLTAPVIGMLSSNNLSAFVVSVVTADFAGHAQAASNMSKIVACQIVKIIEYRVIDTQSPPSPAVARYFSRLQDTADRACSGKSELNFAALAAAPVHATQSQPRRARPRGTSVVQDTVVRYALVSSIKRWPTQPYMYFEGAPTPGGVCAGEFGRYEVPVEDVVRMGPGRQCSADPTKRYRSVVYLRGQGRIYRQDSIPPKRRVP